jgi:putative ABC transport system permease protein
MREAKMRFSLLIVAIALLLFLILAQQAIQDGLISSFVGAITRQSAPVLVYSVDGQRTLQGSVITPALQAKIEGVDGVGQAGKIGQSTFTASIARGRPESVALIGYEKANVGGPDSLVAGGMPAAPGEAVGSDADFAIGDTVRLDGPRSNTEVRIVGLASNAKIQVSPTLFVPWPEYVAWIKAANPDASAVLPSAIGIAPANGTTAREIVARINDASPEADALTRRQAADATPGVANVRNSFRLIFLLFALVVPLVAGLFFLIVTLQQSRTLTLLRAIGVPPGALVRSLLVQVTIVLCAGIALGTLLFVPLSQLKIGSIDLSFDVTSVLLWAVLLLVLGLASAFLAARRVLSIDPIEATTGGGAR